MCLVITQDLVNGLFLSKGYMSGSVTREQYQQCSFGFYAQYGFETRTASSTLSFGAPENRYVLVLFRALR